MEGSQPGFALIVSDEENLGGSRPADRLRVAPSVHATDDHAAAQLSRLPARRWN